MHKGWSYKLIFVGIVVAVSTAHNDGAIEEFNVVEHIDGVLHGHLMLEGDEAVVHAFARLVGGNVHLLQRCDLEE